MNFIKFFTSNARWILGGMLLGFGSSFGQTFFIAQFSGEIRGAYGLSHGEFGSLYMMATLASAFCLVWVGKIVDYVSTVVVGCSALVVLAGFSFFMAWQENVILLALALFGLRLFGQGALPHISQTAMARWFNASRGKALSLANFGNMLGEAMLPLVAVALMVGFGWRNLWVLAGISLLVGFLPVAYLLLRTERTPQNPKLSEVEKGPVVSWTRTQVIKDWRFWLAMAAAIAVPALMTGVMFHQVQLMEAKGWARTTIPSLLPLYAAMGAAFSLSSGALIDRFSAASLLPLMIVPLGAGLLVLSQVHTESLVFLAMLCFSISMGSWGAVMSAYLAESFGTGHLGSIRALYTALMVLGSAVAPGVMGLLVDTGVPLSEQFVYCAAYCFLLSIGLFVVRTHMNDQRAPA
ncbi:MFS transporter [Pseudovibrio sp. SPO723]|uniref:MFS transporter n=1 Tax=Nesiotobacter zosterae TaxID=392721 RepID=UPI0029C1AE00|nr:MFS transporter [Pseudovibrio sp. SPO723]MDX5593710.1 MFS transporter [Pseudovibrio sp. SPO723]